ncbi:MAG: alpha/beta hydrolase [Rhodoferax sp.]|nr:alpha/beta hydrolase [Rhodoferax sp.]
MNSNLPAAESSVPYLGKTREVRVTENVKYGVGGVDYSPATGPARYRDLMLDIYEPAEKTVRPRPALIMAFGGAFHRGSKGAEVFEGEHPSTAVAEYCHEFARRGYVCFSIDYRLMQEAPDPGVTPTMPPGTPLNLDRVNYVRSLLGLPPCTQQMMADEIEAATDDMSQAVAFVRSRAHALGVDVNRVAIGGFSAGAIMALNAALAERAPVAAVVALSGRVSMSTAEAHVTGTRGEPSILMFVGQNDLPAMLENLDGPAQHMKQMGLPCQIVRIAGADHFYLRTVSVTADDGTTTDVENLMAGFLYKHLKLAELCD